jgi:hypothetical protein
MSEKLQKSVTYYLNGRLSIMEEFTFFLEIELFLSNLTGSRKF